MITEVPATKENFEARFTKNWKKVERAGCTLVRSVLTIAATLLDVLAALVHIILFLVGGLALLLELGAKLARDADAWVVREQSKPSPKESQSCPKQETSSAPMLLN